MWVARVTLTKVQRYESLLWTSSHYICTMSTAGRPTYYAAVGKTTYGGARSRQVCVRDQTTNSKLKVRQFGQNTADELRDKDFREEIESREEAHIKEKNRALALITEEERKVDVPLLLLNKPEIDPVVLQKYDDADAEVDYDEKSDDGFDSSRYVERFPASCVSLIYFIVKKKTIMRMMKKNNYKLNCNEYERNELQLKQRRPRKSRKKWID